MSRQAAGSSPCSPGGMLPGIVEGHVGLSWFGQSLSRDGLVCPTSDLHHTTFGHFVQVAAFSSFHCTRLNAVKLIRCEILATFVREARCSILVATKICECSVLRQRPDADDGPSRSFHGVARGAVAVATLPSTQRRPVGSSPRAGVTLELQ